VVNKRVPRQREKLLIGKKKWPASWNRSTRGPTKKEGEPTTQKKEKTYKPTKGRKTQKERLK